MRRKKNWWLMEETDPPAFHMTTTGVQHGRPFLFKSCGGAGKGIVVELRAIGYNPLDYTCEKACLVFVHRAHEYRSVNGWIGIDYSAINDASIQQISHAERHQFEDGHQGWIMRFPDACIERGPDPTIRTKGTMLYEEEHNIYFVTGIFGERYFENPWSLRSISTGSCVYTAIRFYPMENPAGVSFYKKGESIEHDGTITMEPPDMNCYNIYLK